jgi:hypothetical protein
MSGMTTHTDLSNPEDRELYRLATHIVQHDEALTDLLVEAARRLARKKACVAG